MDEMLALNRWIKAKVADDDGAGGLMDLGVAGAYWNLIPRNVALPAVRFTYLSPSDVRGATQASQRIMVRAQTLIVVTIDGPDVDPLVPFANRLDEVFQRAEGSTDDLKVLGCVRTQPFSQRTMEEGKYYSSAGGIYEIHCQELP